MFIEFGGRSVSEIQQWGAPESSPPTNDVMEPMYVLSAASILFQFGRHLTAETQEDDASEGDRHACFRRNRCATQTCTARGA